MAKITWEFNTDHPLDQQVLNQLHKMVKFLQPEQGEPPKNAEAPKTEAPKTEPPKNAEAPKTEKKKGKKGRKPKEKAKEALMKLGLQKMIEYIKSRGEASILECRILAKHYNDEYGEIQSILQVLHDLGANSFDDLEDSNKFAGAAIKMIEAKTSESAADEPGDDLLGL